MNRTAFLRFAVTPILGALIAVSPLRADEAATKTAIAKELEHASIAHGWNGIYIKNLQNQRVIFAMNEDRRMSPASNLKLLVTSCANDVLPQDFHYTTRILREGAVAGGVLGGNLYVKGDGDATLLTSDLAEMARAVKAAGINRVTGDIIGDGSTFDARRSGNSWSWDDAPYDYSGQMDGLNVDHGTVKVHVQPGTVGAAPTVTLEPDAGYLTVRNTAQTVAANEKETLDLGRVTGANILTATGNIRVNNKGEENRLTMEEPSAYVAFLFRKLLRDNGVSVDGAARQGIAPPASPEVARHESPRLPEVLALINKPSDNLLAESLLKTLGREKKGTGSTAAGLDVEREYLTRIGINADTDTHLTDGSGLGYPNEITPRALVGILSYMWTHPNRDAFVNSLSISGESAATPRMYAAPWLKNRMLHTRAEGNARAKTGYIEEVTTMTGYVNSRDGEPLAFSLMFNHYNGPTADIRAIQDRIVVILADSTR